MTLSALSAHNALGAAVQMYTGIIADYERQLEMVKATWSVKYRAIETGANAAAEEVRKLHEQLAVKEHELAVLQSRLDHASGKDASRRELGDDEPQGSRR